MQIIITIKDKIEVIEKYFGKGNISGNEKNISVSCPNCRNNSKNSSNKKKLAISLETGIYHCWVCEIKGRNIGIPAKRYLNVSKNEMIEIIQTFDIKDKKDEEEEKVFINLPQDYELLINNDTRYGRIAKKYLQSRGLHVSDLIKYKIGLSSQNEFINRVIIPSHDDNLKLNFYLSRTVTDDSFLKYKNCLIKRKDIIFNEHLIDWESPLTIVEGVFDAIKVEGNVVPMLGSWMDENYYLFQKIVMNQTPVILALDPDAKDKEAKIANSLIEYGIDAYTVDQNYEKDFGDMSKDEAKEIISNIKKYEKTDRMIYLIQSIKSGSIF